VEESDRRSLETGQAWVAKSVSTKSVSAFPESEWPWSARKELINDPGIARDDYRPAEETGSGDQSLFVNVVPGLRPPETV
jgi:hypothetical protein